MTATIAAETTFQVVEAGTPTVHVAKRLYTTDEDITVTFCIGPRQRPRLDRSLQGNEVPGTSGISSTRYLYVDGTQNGAVALTDGSVRILRWPHHPRAGTSPSSRETTATTCWPARRSRLARPRAICPRLLSIRPADGATGVEPRIRFNATITNGTSSVLLSSIGLKLDGASVQPVVTSANGLVTVSYTNAGISLPLSAHLRTQLHGRRFETHRDLRQGSFTTVQYENIVLPRRSASRTSIPPPKARFPRAGPSPVTLRFQNPDLDLGNLDSASFANWVVLDVNRFTGSFVTYSNPENPADWGTDYQRVLTPNRNNVLNGAEVDGPLASGRMLFGDSGYRNGRSQVLSITTPTTISPGRIRCACGLQESLRTESGQHWGSGVFGGWRRQLAARRVLDQRGDIIRTEAGDVDAEATLTTSANDIAVYSDDAGNDVGGTYGAFIGAPINASLAPFIQGRVDDNSKESKRIEKYRLPKADGAKTVRLRFTHAGTDSWYWGVDDFDCTPSPPKLPRSPRRSRPPGLRLTWTGDTTDSP